MWCRCKHADLGYAAFINLWVIASVPSFFHDLSQHKVINTNQTNCSAFKSVINMVMVTGVAGL